MEDNNKAVGPLAAAKLVSLIKAETAKKYDKTGGKIDGSAEIAGGLKVGGSSEFSSSIKAGSEISSDMLLMAPIVALYDPATEENVFFGVSGENAAKVTSSVSGGGVQYARLAVGTPTGDNDAATKAYVDGHAAGYEVITVTSTNVSDLGYDAEEGAIKYTVTFDASFDSILANLASNKPMKFNITIPDNDGGIPISFNTGYVSALGNFLYLFTGTLVGAPIVLSINALGAATIYIYGDCLPEPNPDGSDNGKVPTVNGTRWEMKKAVVDDALSDTSTNPVQNKVVKKALDGKASTEIASQTANGLMSKEDKDKLDHIAYGATQVTIDSDMSGSSNNPVANHVVKQYIDDKVAAAGGSITVDTSLSSTSTNPVQNKAVKAAIDAKADKTALDGKLDKTGGTLTGNLTGKYITGTWLQSTAASDLGSTPGKIAVLDDSGWMYYRTPAELLADIGAMSGGDYYTKAETDAAIAVRASTSAYGTTKLSNSTTSSSKTLAATPYAVKTALAQAKAYVDSAIAVAINSAY